jgi:hypothetical protein
MMFVVNDTFLRLMVATDIRAHACACACAQREAIADFNPQAVVASSWGGRVALRCMELGYWRGPTVLLAPAVSLCPWWGQLVWPSWTGVLPAEAALRCVVVQGRQDILVSPGAVQQMCRHNDGIRLELVQGDHRLNSALGLVKGQPQRGRLSQLVTDVIARSA